MPITYTIDVETSTIHTRMIGALSTDDVREHFEQLVDDPARPDRLWVLIDASELRSVPTIAMIEMTRRMAELSRAQLRLEAAAVVAKQPAHFGMFRMGQVLLEKIFTETHVCRDVDEAWAWLAAQRQGAER